MHHDYRVFDADGHVIESEGMWARYIDPAFRDRAPVAPAGYTWVRVDGQWLPALWDEATMGQVLAGMMDQTRARPSSRFGEAATRGFDPPSQLAAMDREGIDRGVVYPTQGLYVTAIDGMDPALASAVCRAYNQWLAEFCRATAGRVAGAALVNLHDPAAAVAEARRAVEELGLRAVFVRPNRHNGRNLHDPAYEPLWSTIEALGVPLAVHEGSGARLPVTGADRFLNNVLMQHVASHPLEMMCAVESIVCGGVLERHPRLRVAFLEAGASWLPYWLWRLDEHFESLGRRDTPDVKLRPSEYFRRQCFASVECDEEPLGHAIASIGDDCLMFASDYPHADAKYPHAVETFLALPNISEMSRRKLLWENAVRLYDLG